MKDCKECGKPVDLKAGDEITPEIGRINDDYGEVELCRACFSKGWSFDEKEIAEAFNKDPGFKLGIKSPFN